MTPRLLRLLPMRGRGQARIAADQSPQLTAELNDGVPDIGRVNHKRVARVMRVAGIAGDDGVKTTTPDPANQKVSDLLRRDIQCRDHQRQVGRGHHLLPLATGANLYLATVIDCCSRRLQAGRLQRICAAHRTRRRHA
ncbi:hypothetical protein [Mycobacterium dioxanotrophicus]|uniref:hypothetical protein n=1 Tax=Mycobacterium dioxanotrophicus TaxID=482462 RepID=UPI0012F7EA45|nr:hypothetical protein [Mycobacterium dioxanotrophicus]